MKNPDQLTSEILNQFTGSEHFYRHGLIRDVLSTDGAKHVAEHAHAFWLLDLIAIEQRFNSTVGAEEFPVLCSNRHQTPQFPQDVSRLAIAPRLR